MCENDYTLCELYQHNSSQVAPASVAQAAGDFESGKNIYFRYFISIIYF